VALVHPLTSFLAEALLVEAISVQVGGPQILGLSFIWAVLVGHGLVKNAWATSLAASPGEIFEVFVVQGLLWGLHHGGLHLTFGQEPVHLSLELVELVDGAVNEIQLGINEAHLVVDPGLCERDGVLGSLVLGDHYAVKHFVITPHDDLVLIALTMLGGGLDFFGIIVFIEKSVAGVEGGKATEEPFGGNL
jgi:hypothetical protein